MTQLRRANRPTSNVQPETPYRWWHAAAAGLAANALSAAPAGFNGDDAFYNDLKKPPAAPPDWLFPVAWGVNNLTTLWSNLRVANLPKETPGRRTALALEGVSWGLFASFTTLYFGLRSPVLGAANTAAGLATTAASVAVTAKLDRKAAWALTPRLAWLGLAAYVSASVARRNPDAFIGWDPGFGSDPEEENLEDMRTSSIAT